MKPNPALDARMRERGFISIPEASDRTGISRSTLYDAIAQDLVAATTVGSRRYVQIDSLLEYAGPGGRALFEEA